MNSRGIALRTHVIPSLQETVDRSASFTRPTLNAATARMASLANGVSLANGWRQPQALVSSINATTPTPVFPRVPGRRPSSRRRSSPRGWLAGEGASGTRRGGRRPLPTRRGAPPGEAPRNRRTLPLVRGGGGGSGAAVRVLFPNAPKIYSGTKRPVVVREGRPSSAPRRGLVGLPAREKRDASDLRKEG